MAGVHNSRLRSAMSAAEMSTNALAAAVEVDAKSVERWVTQGRQPHARTRAQVAKVLGFDETYFWPELLGTGRSIGASQAELVQLWPTRDAVPADVWRTLIAQSHECIEVLVYAGGFLFETFHLVDTVREKAAQGVRVRILVGDSSCDAVRARATEEGLPTLAARCLSTLEYLTEVMSLDGVAVRTHRTTLYASQFSFDDSMLVNTHTYGSWAARSPVQHLRRVPEGQIFRYYTDTFERVWATGRDVS